MLARNHGSCWKKGSFNAPSCMGRTGTLRVPAQYHNRLLPESLSTARNVQHEGSFGKELRDVCLGKVGAAVLSTLLLVGSSVGVQPCAAVDLGTLQQQQQQQVSGNPYTSLAKPLPKQSVDKKRVWTILLGGAVVLFASTLVVENLEDWFPAIARANKAMALSRKKAEQQERKQSQADVEAAQAVATQQQQQQLQQQQSSAAVEAGLAEARQKVLGNSSPAQQPSQTSAPAPPSASYPSVLDSGNVQGTTRSSMTSSDGGSSSNSSSSNRGSDGGPGAPPAAPHSRSPSQEGDAQASTASAESAEEGARSESGASTSNTSSSTSGNDGKVWLSTDEINAARSMRMQLGEPGASDGAAAVGTRGASGADTAAVALQPGAPAGADNSAAAAAAAVTVAVGSNASKTARLEKFVGGVMREGNQAGFLSGMKQEGRAPRS